MDIGKFKASKARLILWLLLPPLLILSIGLSAYTLRLQSDWELGRAHQLADVFPSLVQVQDKIRGVMAAFKADVNQIHSEDEFMAFLRQAAQRSGYGLDSVKVDRSASKSTPVLTALVNGSGTYDEIQRFLGEVSEGQYLLSEKSLKITLISDVAGNRTYSADITFSLVMFNAGKAKS